MKEHSLILPGFMWNEAKPLDPTLPNIRSGLLHIAAFTARSDMKFIGTGFIVALLDDIGIALSAAHNFYGAVQQIQAPPPRHHQSALAEFLPNGEEISLSEERLRIVHAHAGQDHACSVKHLACDRKADLALLTFTSANFDSLKSNARSFDLTNSIPDIGDYVVLAGFRKMNVISDEINADNARIVTLNRQLSMRVGRIKKQHLDGHILCRGPCVETTIPLFAGTSGGPALICSNRGEATAAFGLISSDPDEPLDVKADMSRSGSSIVSLIPYRCTVDGKGARTAHVDFINEMKFCAQDVL